MYYVELYICIKKIKQFVYKGEYGFKFNFDPLVDMNLSILKFKLTTHTYKSYAYSKFI